MKDKIKKLKQFVVDDHSKWEDITHWHEESKDFIKKSTIVSIRILSILRRRGITQIELAERMCVSPQMVSKIIKGRENITLATLEKIENALGEIILDVPKEDMPQQTFVIKKVYVSMPAIPESIILNTKERGRFSLVSSDEVSLEQQYIN